MITLLSKNFWYQNISERQKDSPTMFFGDLGQKDFDGKTWHPLLIHIFFLLENFWNTKAFPTKFFGTVRIKLFHGKSLNSSFMHKVFGWPSFYESLKGSPQKIRQRETKKFKKVVIVCYPKFFRYQRFLNYKGPPTKFVWYCETKTINKIVIPVLSQKILKPEFFWNTGGFAHDDFWRCETKKRTKLWYPFYLKTFDTRTFLKHRGVHPRCFSAIWDQKTSTEKRDTPFLSKNLFRTRNFLKDKNVPPRCFSVLWD